MKGTSISEQGITFSIRPHKDQEVVCIRLDRPDREHPDKPSWPRFSSAAISSESMGWFSSLSSRDQI